MIFPFDVNDKAIVVLTKIWGSKYLGKLSLVLDTGAEISVINRALLRSMGFDTARHAAKMRLGTASGALMATKVVVPKIVALGQTHTNFELASCELPRSIACDGLLGLDFLRGFELNINFKTGQIQLK